MKHVGIINSWPSLSDFANDLDIAYGTAKAMRSRGTIPAKYWATVISKARKRRIAGVTADTLARSLAAEVAA